MTEQKRSVDADVLLEKLKEMAGYIKDAYTDESYKVLELEDVIQSIKELATPAPEPQEICKSNLTKFTMQLFDAIGQNVEAGKIAIDDDDFDKMETIAFRLIDAMNLLKDNT